MKHKIWKEYCEKFDTYCHKDMFKLDEDDIIYLMKMSLETGENKLKSARIVNCELDRLLEALNSNRHNTLNRVLCQAYEELNLEPFNMDISYSILDKLYSEIKQSIEETTDKFISKMSGMTFKEVLETTKDFRYEPKEMVDLIEQREYILNIAMKRFKGEPYNENFDTYYVTKAKDIALDFIENGSCPFRTTKDLIKEYEFLVSEIHKDLKYIYSGKGELKNFDYSEGMLAKINEKPLEKPVEKPENTNTHETSRKPLENSSEKPENSSEKPENTNIKPENTLEKYNNSDCKRICLIASAADSRCSDDCNMECIWKNKKTGIANVRAMPIGLRYGDEYTLCIESDGTIHVYKFNGDGYDFITTCGDITMFDSIKEDKL